MREMNLFEESSKDSDASGEGLIHYEGDLGCFDYSPEDYELIADGQDVYLHYKGKTIALSLPKGIKSTKRMFQEIKFPANFHFEDFDTSNVTDMSGMFSLSRLSKDFTLGANFDTSNVTDMSGMFGCCTMCSGFTLGDKFDTSKVINMNSMFRFARLPKGFTLGANFNTKAVKSMIAMFMICNIPAKFSFGDKFDTSNVTDMSGMFSGSILPKGFTLPREFKFNTAVKTEDMFDFCAYYNGTKDICDALGYSTPQEIVEYLREEC